MNASLIMNFLVFNSDNILKTEITYDRKIKITIEKYEDLVMFEWGEFVCDFLKNGGRKELTTWLKGKLKGEIDKKQIIFSELLK